MSPRIKAISIILMLLLLIVTTIMVVLLFTIRNRACHTSEKFPKKQTVNLEEIRSTRPSWTSQISIPKSVTLEKSKKLYLRRRSKRSLEQSTFNESRQDRDTEINVKLPISSSEHISDEYLEELAQNILGKLRNTGDSQEDLNAEEQDEEEDVGEPNINHHSNFKPTVKSALECDEWIPKQSTCFFDRNIGDTITFQLHFEDMSKGHVLRVQWKQEYHIKFSNHSKSIEIHSEDSLWNVVVGSNDREFRVSPITETDFYFNHFTAVAHISESEFSPHSIIRKISFAIRPVPNDLGNVYPGEQLILPMRSYVSLPLESIEFHWFYEREAEKSTLPSNMKVSQSGSSVKISELRREQEGVISCAVYKTTRIFLTQKRFLIKEISKELLDVESSQNKHEQRHNSEHTILRRFIRQINPLLSHKEEPLIPTSFKAQVSSAPVIIPQDSNTPSPQYNLAISNNNPLSEGPQEQPCRQLPCPISLSQQPDSVMSYQPESQFSNMLSQQDLMDEPEEITLELGKHQDLGETVEDKVAELLAKCTIDRECSGHASCVVESNKQGVCQCHPGYRGNGLFCWEMIIPGQTPVT